MDTVSLRESQPYLVAKHENQASDRDHVSRQLEAEPATPVPRWNSLEDAVLIAYCKAGNDDAWNTLMGRYLDPIKRYAWSLCRNQADAEDITARTLIRIYARLHSFQRQTSFYAWAVRIAHNLYSDTFVRPRYLDVLSLDAEALYDGTLLPRNDLVDPAPTPEAVCLDHASAESILRDIDHLPSHLRPVLQLRLQGCSYEQIASLLNVAIGTVKSRIHRARTMLHERLEP